MNNAQHDHDPLSELIAVVGLGIIGTACEIAIVVSTWAAYFWMVGR
jgi:hypothetical protein